MKKNFTRILSLALALSMILLTFSGCNKNDVVEQDTSPITIYVPMGNGQDFCETLCENIKSELGIDVEFVYQKSSDTTTMTRNFFKNGDLPADIMFTASKTPDEYMKNTCIDFLENSHITSVFTSRAIKTATADDGGVYQLPFTSKLIGVTYNETLLNELGAEVPTNFEEMVALKELCDQKGVTFAVSGGVATGHGFNWLFHLMGADWLSTIDGTNWIEKFQNGETDVSEFKEACSYFKKYVEAGLFGELVTDSWGDAGVYNSTRALFWYGVTNSQTGYTNEETGKTDVYKTMPWISEDGSNNCFTTYDNFWVSINKDLEAPEKADKLEKVLQIVEYLASDTMESISKDLAADVYIGATGFEVDDTRLYSNYESEIKAGFVQPWYYNYFDNAAINEVGQAVNEYMRGTGSFDNIFTVLTNANNNTLNSTQEVLFTAEEKLDYADVAKILAIAGADALDLTLSENGINTVVEVSLMPYTETANAIQPFLDPSVSNSTIYKGDFLATDTNTLVPPNVMAPSAIYLTGKQIKSIVSAKFDPSEYFLNDDGTSKFDSSKYGPYPYICLTRDGSELQDDKTYLVAVPSNSIPKDIYASATKIENLSNAHTYQEGITIFGESYTTISSSTIAWK